MPLFQTWLKDVSHKQQESESKNQVIHLKFSQLKYLRIIPQLTQKSSAIVHYRRYMQAETRATKDCKQEI